MVLCRAVALPYFRRSETGRWRGSLAGRLRPVSARWTRSNDPIFDARREAARLKLFITDDYNGPDAIGFGAHPVHDPQWTTRISVNAYLKPALSRSGLSLLTNATVTGVTMRGTQASGVEFVHQGVAERTEVILCGGVFNFPQLLILAGIGPTEHLRRPWDRAVG